MTEPGQKPIDAAALIAMLDDAGIRRARAAVECVPLRQSQRGSGCG